MKYNFVGKKALVVVSAGGHLVEALQLSENLGISSESVYVTSDNSQTRSLLFNRRSYFMPQIKSRDLFGAAKAVPEILKLSSSEGFDCIISTGAAIAISALPTHLLHRKPFYYFESLTRVDQPSLTGKILRVFPSVKLHSPFAAKFDGRWRYTHSILTSYVVQDRLPKSSGLRILVTLGTIPNFRFDRLVDSVLSALDEQDEVYWQLGCTTRENLPGQSFEIIENNDLINLATSCDVVISHCGIGTILQLLSNGVRPIVLPRRSDFNEHVDNHQIEAIDAFYCQNLVAYPKEKITRADLNEASTKFVIKAEQDGPN